VAPKLHALSYMMSPLCRPVSAWAVNLFLPNLGVGRLVHRGCKSTLYCPYMPSLVPPRERDQTALRRPAAPPE
jgi:hypothetical protein